ncbi:unnamed protein product [Caenorhabditis brenneri]
MKCLQCSPLNHQKSYGLLNNHVCLPSLSHHGSPKLSPPSKEKDLDLSTVSDLIKHGSSKGPYPQLLANQIWESLLLLFTILRPSNAFQHAVDLYREVIEAQLTDAASVLRPLLNYPEFAPGNIEIVPTDQWQDTLFDFQREPRYPIYFDTEGLYSERSFGCDIAALTFYDVEQKKVLIVRINRFNCQDYQRVQSQIRGIRTGALSP